MNIKGHSLRGKLAATLQEHLHAAIVYLLDYEHGLTPVSHEWYWRDLRLGLSRGRNHRGHERLAGGEGDASVALHYKGSTAISMAPISSTRDGAESD